MKTFRWGSSIAIAILMLAAGCDSRSLVHDLNKIQGRPASQTVLVDDVHARISAPERVAVGDSFAVSVTLINNRDRSVALVGSSCPAVSSLFDADGNQVCLRGTCTACALVLKVVTVPPNGAKTFQAPVRVVPDPYQAENPDAPVVPGTYRLQNANHWTIGDKEVRALLKRPIEITAPDAN